MELWDGATGGGTFQLPAGGAVNHAIVEGGTSSLSHFLSFSCPFPLALPLTFADIIISLPVLSRSCPLGLATV